MSDTAAYRLRARPTARSVRQAWDVALETAIRRLSDAAFSRALHGVARPVFYRGEQIGERRYYDERLTQFLLRYRDPVRYGAWNDKMRHEQTHPDAPAIRLAHALNRVSEAAVAEDEGVPPPRERPFHPNTFVSAKQQETDEQRREEYAEELHRLRMNDAWERSPRSVGHLRHGCRRARVGRRRFRAGRSPNFPNFRPGRAENFAGPRRRSCGSGVLRPIERITRDRPPTPRHRLSR